MARLSFEFIGRVRWMGRVRWAGIARVAAYIALLNFGIGYLLMRSAFAGAERNVQRLGNALAAQLGGALIGQTQAVSVNGQLLFFAAQTSVLPVKTVLDQFDANCRAHSGGLREQFERMPGFQERLARLPESMRDLDRIGIMRSDTRDAPIDEPEAHLVCIAQPGHAGLKGVVAGVEHFISTGDLSRIGDARYVAARKLDNGQTQVIAIWTEGAFNIEAMFPDVGDAPGTDTPEVPRPPKAVRRLSAVVPNHPYALRSYDSELSRVELLRFYDTQMPAAGWTLRPSAGDADSPLSRGPETRAFTREGRAVLINVNDEQPAARSITVLDLGGLNRVVTNIAIPD